MRSCRQERGREERRRQRQEKMRHELPAEGALTAKLKRWKQACRSMGSLGVTGQWGWVKQSEEPNLMMLYCLSATCYLVFYIVLLYI